MSLSPEGWEALCKRCGRCCFEKVRLADGGTGLTNQPCPFLNRATRRCKVYERRFEVCPDCLPLTEDSLAEIDWLPEDCGYVEYDRQSRGATLGRKSQEERNKEQRWKIGG